MNATTDNGASGNGANRNSDWRQRRAAGGSTSDLEREGEQIRADLDRTLDEIERKFSPGELLDRSMEFLRDNGSEFLKEAGETVRRNPVPVLLTAAGLIWLTTAVASSRSSSARFSARRDEGKEEFSEYRGSSAGEYGDAGEGLDNFVEQGSRRGAKSRVRATTRNLKGKLSNSMQTVQEQTERAGANLGNLVREQPVALGALALAAGALLGAALPITQYENRVIGPAHDRAMARAKQAGERQYENLRQKVTSSTEQGSDAESSSTARSDQGSPEAPEQG